MYVMVFVLGAWIGVGGFILAAARWSSVRRVAEVMRAMGAKEEQE